MSTPHNSAQKGDFAKTVIMPGDPKRSEYIAKTFLTDVKLVNDVRGIKGYTGFYKGKEVSVMAHGMGMPSMSIYAYELFNFYDVENIIRVGTCGGMRKNINLRDVIVASETVTDSNIGRVYTKKKKAYPSEKLVDKVLTLAAEKNLSTKCGTILCSDNFYNDQKSNEKWAKKGVAGVDMESFALYNIAKAFNKNSVCILTVSDLVYDNEQQLTPEERQQSINDMIILALETAITL